MVVICHSERSEESLWASEILRCAQNDIAHLEWECSPGKSGRNELSALNTAIRAVRPLLLHGIVADRFCLPGADVADFAVGLVIPALTGNRVCDRLVEFVRTGGCERVKCREVGGASRTVGIGHDGVKDLTVDGIVIAAKRRAGA